jgi:hypothetical protein
MSGLIVTKQIFRTESASELAELITQSNGPFIRLADAWHLLGYPSIDAARKAAARRNTPVQVLELPARRGRYVRSVDLANWLYAAIHGESPGR